MIINGDAKYLPLADSSVDSIVCDPPYELGFMGKVWDKSGIAYDVEVWREALRVLKPGGYLLAFGGTRTYHRMACAIEDAGFEIRDQIQWIYGSGFPKSLDVSKAIDKLQNVDRPDAIPGGHMGAAGRSHGNDYINQGGLNIENTIPSIIGKGSLTRGTPVTDEAIQWEGFGTALKPANEPICLARKPLSEKTVAQNVLKWGTGAINIDGCRIDTADNLNGGAYAAKGRRATSHSLSPTGINRPGATAGEFAQPAGRFPANVIHDGADEVLEHFPNSKGQQGDLTNHLNGRESANGIFNKMKPALDHLKRGDSGSAARFFYCAKTSKSDRNEGLENFEIQTKIEHSHGRYRCRNCGKLKLDHKPCVCLKPDFERVQVNQNHHPTVKPTSLMRYLCRLTTPPGGIVLDMFAGSGSTGKAAKLEGFQFIIIEKEFEYVEIAKARINPPQASLF